ncbi:hypothetical protein HELRODRAFT_171277 [Helobdella robusta]|uniref:Uncharacterized protein n=1 Tax=Helobdella robusta TaxID=6412 RepID=T1F409_HELRO|nr:hypothetical protein HELRODRAFT_171277 [Helobdella robusta]ESO05623.1 hypothetical protein HELRODRAFT_171277 [Helobdella robusta]
MVTSLTSDRRNKRCLDDENVYNLTFVALLHRDRSSFETSHRLTFCTFRKRTYCTFCLHSSWLSPVTPSMTAFNLFIVIIRKSNGGSRLGRGRADQYSHQMSVKLSLASRKI